VPLLDQLTSILGSEQTIGSAIHTYSLPSLFDSTLRSTTPRKRPLLSTPLIWIWPSLAHSSKVVSFNGCTSIYYFSCSYQLNTCSVSTRDETHTDLLMSTEAAPRSQQSRVAPTHHIAKRHQSQQYRKTRHQIIEKKELLIPSLSS
jgi:hypothetical protein